MRRLFACLLTVAVVAFTVSADSAAVAKPVVAKPAVTAVAPVKPAVAQPIKAVNPVVKAATAVVKDAAAAVKVAAVNAQTNVKLTDSSVTADTLVKNASAVVKAVRGMKTNGVTLVLLIALIIKLLVSILQLPVLAKVFDTPKVKPLKPYIALVIGILSGFAASASTGQSMTTSIIAGITAGFGATGIHETLKSVRGKNV